MVLAPPPTVPAVPTLLLQIVSAVATRLLQIVSAVATLLLELADRQAREEKEKTCRCSNGSSGGGCSGHCKRSATRERWVAGHKVAGACGQVLVGRDGKG